MTEPAANSIDSQSPDELPRQSAEGPPSIRETPARGSRADIHTDTPTHGVAAAVPGNASADEPPFERLGHFQIVERIGSGGMGDVYKGYDASLDRYVAIKVLPAVLARDEDFVRRFRAEAAAVAKLAHPNVVPIHFIGQDAGHHFFALRFIEGESLGQRLAVQRKLPLQQATAIVEQCLAGLAAAHDQGLVHRDVKPGNVLLDRGSGQAVLVDFGLVRQMGRAAQMTATGVVMGTVDYIAPEQARGKQIDGRSDIYSLGVMFYQLLAGRLPYSAETPTAMMFQHAYEPPFPLGQAAPDVPQPLVDVVARMMAKDPAERYGSCAEVLADLRAFREGRPVVAMAAGTSAPASDPIGALAARKPAPSDAGRLGDDQANIAPAAPGRETYPGPPTLSPDVPWQRAKDWMATMFRRHAPEALQELRSTTQQMDGALAEHERRLKRLRGLVDEAHSVIGGLAAQIGTTERAAQDLEAHASKSANPEAMWDKLRSCREELAALHAQHDEQQGQAAPLEIELAKAEATLVRLRGQRDMLMARMKAVETRQRAEGTALSPRTGFRSKRTVMLAAAGVAALAVGTYLLWPRTKLPAPPVPSEPIAQAPPVAAVVIPMKAEQPAAVAATVPVPIAPPPHQKPATVDAPVPAPIVPPPSDPNKVVVPLPGPVVDVVTGGGGRYLIWRLAGRQLAVFDVQTGIVVKQIPLAEEKVHVAAGAERLVIIDPGAKLIHLWKLKTLRRERSVLLPENIAAHTIHQVCMGSASTGPLFAYLADEKRTVMLELDTMATTDVHWTHWAPNNAYGPLDMRVSPDDSMLIGWGGGWAGSEAAFFNQGKQTGSNPNVRCGLAFALPSADNRYIFVNGGMHSRTLAFTEIPGLGGAFIVPAAEPGYFLSLAKMAGWAHVGDKLDSGQVSVYNYDRRMLFALSKLDELKSPSPLPWEKRIHYYPLAGVLVTVGAEQDRLIVRRVNLVEELTRSGADYLVVLSQPPAAKAGSRFDYNLDIRSKAGGVKVSLGSGPDGLNVSPAGLVTWDVPSKPEGPEYNVVVTIHDASGQEVFHTFTIRVVE
jgi:serine/threonine protein kinase